jgi:AmmeMemoRadiSam system protein B
VTIRPSRVAGYFYPARKEELLRFLKEVHEDRPREKAVAVLVPHAGYVYSGAVAGKTYSRVELPSNFLVLCPNHTGLGKPFSVMAEGAWETPLGRASIDEALARELLRGPWLEPDEEAHAGEHAIEVQIPFLQHFKPGLRFVPLAVGSQDLNKLEEIGVYIGNLLREMDEKPLLVISSDLNHYEDEEITIKKDRLAISALETLDECKLAQSVENHGISMCGFAAAYAGLIAAKIMGAKRAELVDHTTSAPRTGDYERVVGYAGMIFS